MTDRISPETIPNHSILIRIGVTPTDIPPCFLEGPTGAQIPQNDTETLRKIRVSVRVEVLPERSVAPCRE